MAQFVQWLQEKTVPFADGSQQTVDLVRGRLVRETVIDLDLTPTLTGANNTPAGVGGGGAWAVVKRLEVVLNGSQVILNLSGRELMFANLYGLGRAPEHPDTLGDGATANPALHVRLVIPWWLPRSVKPFDTVFDTRRLSTLQLRITWGTFTDVHANATAWTSDPVLTVSTLASQGGIPDNARFTAWRRSSIQQTISASSSQFQVIFPVGFMYRGALFHMEDGGVDSGAILNNIKVRSGSVVFVDLAAYTLQAWINERYGMQTRDLPAIYTRGANDPAGWVLWDHVSDGRNREAIDTLNLSEFLAELDVTLGAGTTTLTTIPTQLIPVRQ